MDDKKYKEIVESEYFCAYPFVQISTVPAGHMRPCCFFTDFLRNDDGAMANVDNNDFQNVWNNNEFRNIRSSLVQAKKINGCQQCHKEDSFGGDSMRKRSLREWVWRPDFRRTVEAAVENSGALKEQLKFLELKPGNLCNLKCRMCNQFDSSKYATELQEIGARFSTPQNQSRLFGTYSFEYDFTLEKMADWTNNPKIWKSFEKLAPHLEILSFAGGEPTLIDDVYKGLKYCVDNGYAKNITVYFASNFTQPMGKFIELAKNFKRFDFIASIDGTSHIQEYIRYPSKWSVIDNNFREVNQASAKNENIILMINLTLNLYNILYFTDLLTWLESKEMRGGLREDPFNLNILCFPEYLSLDLLPNDLRPLAIARTENFLKSSWICAEKNHIKARVEQLIEMLKKPLIDDEVTKKRIEEFWIYTKVLDQHRKQKMSDAMPELYSSLENMLKNIGFDFEGTYKKYQITP